MIFNKTPLRDVYLIEPRVFGDERGFFYESWNRESFREAGFNLDFVQDNHSRSARGTLRGMHFQTAHTQGKLVRVTLGSVFDAVVDCRQSSPSFGWHYGVTLSADNHHMLWVPPGFAHGFLVTSEVADFQYKCTDSYDPDTEVSLRWDDPTVAIDWPLPAGKPPTLSAKDAVALRWQDIPLFD